MRLFNKKRLLRLIAESENIPSRIDNVSIGQGVHGGELLEIYTRREETAGSIYDGFEELLMSLKGRAEDSLRVNVLESSGKTIFVFTDRKIEQIVGILIER